MKKNIQNRVVAFAFALGILSILNPQISTARPLDTAFMFEGWLTNTVQHGNGHHYIRFQLATDATGTNYVGPAITNDVLVKADQFDTELDFGNVFDGSPRWLEISVARKIKKGEYDKISQRVPLTPTPYAIFADIADTASNFLGTISAAQLPPGVVTNTESGVTLDSLNLTGALNLPSPVSITSGGQSLLYSDGNNNFFAGLYAGNPANDSGGFNTANGDGALQNNTSGDNNVAVGTSALQNNTNGFQNVAVGYQSLQANTSGYNNAAVGTYSLLNNASGANNVAFGSGTLQQNVDGQNNTALGYQSLQNDVNGSGNVAVGANALVNSTNGSSNIIIGNNAGYNLHSSDNNIEIGNNGVDGEIGVIRIGDPNYQNSAYIAGIYNASIIGSPVVVNSSGQLGVSASLAVQNLIASNSISATNIDTGDNGLNVEGAITGTGLITANSGISVAGGTLDLASPEITSGGTSIFYSDGSGNLFAGVDAGNVGNDTGNDNTANGAAALANNTSGADNTANGFEALAGNTIGGGNTANGVQALASNTTGDNNTANGDVALFYNTSGSENTANGAAALFANKSGGYNTANGYEALFNNTNGISNTANGCEALFANVTGFENTANGYRALYLNESGGGNTANGFEALDNLVTGDNNIALGFLAGQNLSSGNNNIDIGNQGVYSDNGIIRIGDSQTATYLVGTVYANSVALTSDRNAKEDFSTINPQQVLAKVAALPVTEWNYKTMKNVEHIGPMAQDFQAAFGLNGKDDKHISVVDEGGVALAAIQGLNQKVNEKDAEIQKQNTEIQSLQQSLAELKTMVSQLAKQKSE